MSMVGLERFLKEDIGRGDVTAGLIPDVNGRASIICEEDAVIAGLEEACEIFSIIGGDATALVKDGARVRAGTRIISVSGPVRGLLSTERTALNFLMKMSGIATATSAAADLLREKDPDILVCGTRKTTPGFREYEKKAVRLGGGAEHRFGLDDMVLIKDNHIKACGSVRSAMERASKAPFNLKIEIEVSSIEDAETAAEMGADIIMADNMKPVDVKKLRAAVHKKNPRALVEASGNITLANVAKYAGCADLVSMGSLTHSSGSIQFSMDLD
ncbi:MAG: carboxylating nicotinate-nucleotide diphosphorylase [Methanomassiliicoccaceae archaeon]|nr:carboxylating nicotinate-nucleotide diphosphorylase [Methanomassiliicoccaceae archaeon]